MALILRFLFQLRRDIDNFYRKYFTTNETRYNEVMFVADHLMVSCSNFTSLAFKPQTFNTSTVAGQNVLGDPTLAERNKKLAHIHGELIYYYFFSPSLHSYWGGGGRINIRVVFVSLEIWSNGDPFTRSEQGATDLSNFNNYRKKHLVPRFHHDNAHLLK